MAVLDLGKVVPEKGTDYFTEQDIEEIVSEVKSEITVPTKTSNLTNDSGFIDKTVNDLTNYELKTNTGATIELSINSSTYVMTMVLKNSSGTALSTQTVDLPLESVVVSGSYDNTNKKIVLTLQNGSTIDVPVGDLVSGLQAEITNNNKLSSDLVDDTNHTNLFVTASEKATWNGKQDTLTAGTGISINNNVISATGGDLTNYVKVYTTTTKTVTSNDFITAFQNMIDDYKAGITSFVHIQIDTTSDRIYKNLYKVDGLYSGGRYYCTQIADIVDTANTNTLSRIEGKTIAYTIYLNNEGVISSIQEDTTYYPYSNFLATDVNYSSPYTPLYNGSPATKKYVDDITGNLTDLGTTDKTSLVNAINEVASSSGGGSGDYPKVFYLYNDNKYDVPTSGSDTNATRMAQVSQFITDAVNNNIRPQLIFVCNNTYVEALSDFGEKQVCSYTMKTNPTQKTSYVFRSDEQWIHKYTLGKASTFSNYGSGKYYLRYTLTITGSWSDNVFTATSISFGYENCGLNQMLATVSTVLTRDNEDAYTPTTDYHPATKKYVDDKLTTYTGYDSTKTQILKNINGTLTWVDE